MLIGLYIYNVLDLIIFRFQTCSDLKRFLCPSMFVLMSKYTCTCDSDLTQTYFCLYILHKTTVIFLNTLREADFIHLLFFQDYVTLNLFNTTKCTNNANCMLDFLEQSQIYFIMEILNFIILFDRMEQRVLGLIPQKY